MLLLGQVLEDIRENLFAAKDKNFNLIKKPVFVLLML
jgi:hypothetical protein